MTRCKRRNLKKIWNHFTELKRESEKTIEGLLLKVDVIERAIANSYRLYDEQTFTLRRRVEQLEVEKELLKERLKISNMLSHIRDNTRSVDKIRNVSVESKNESNAICLKQKSKSSLSPTEKSQSRIC